MNLNFFFHFSILIILLQPLFSQTILSGTLNSDSTLTLAQSPYLLIGDFYIKNNAILDIEKGCKILGGRGTFIVENSILTAKDVEFTLDTNYGYINSILLIKSEGLADIENCIFDDVGIFVARQKNIAAKIRNSIFNEKILNTAGAVELVNNSFNNAYILFQNCWSASNSKMEGNDISNNFILLSPNVDIGENVILTTNQALPYRIYGGEVKNGATLTIADGVEILGGAGTIEVDGGTVIANNVIFRHDPNFWITNKGTIFFVNNNGLIDINNCVFDNLSIETGVQQSFSIELTECSMNRFIDTKSPIKLIDNVFNNTEILLSNTSASTSILEGNILNNTELNLLLYVDGENITLPSHQNQPYRLRIAEVKNGATLTIADGVEILGGAGTIEVDGGTVIANNVIFRHDPNFWITNKGTIFFVNNSGLIDINNCVFDNLSITFYHSGSSGKINYSSFNKQGKAITNFANQVINAEYNYWGSETGPTHPSNPEGMGAAVSDNVDFIPFLTSPQPELINEDLLPIAKFNIQDIDELGTAGLVASSNILGFFIGAQGLAYGASLLSTVAEMFGEYLLQEAIVTILDSFEDQEIKPVHQILAVKLNSNNCSVDKDDFCWIFESDRLSDNDKLEIGFPSRVQILKYSSPTNSYYSNGIIGEVIASAKIPQVEGFKSIKDASNQMKTASWVGETTQEFFTYGVVTRYLQLENETYIILEQYQPNTAIIIGEIYNLLYFMPVKVDPKFPLPKIGSLVLVDGYTKRVPYVLDLHREWWRTGGWLNHVLIPEQLEIINGETITTPSVGSKLLYNIYIEGQVGESILLHWPEDDIDSPDIEIKDFRLSPTGKIKNNNEYSINLDLKNLGNNINTFDVSVYYGERKAENLIGQKVISELKNGEHLNLEFEWNINNEMNLSSYKPLKLLTFIDNTKPVDQNIANNYTEYECEYQDEQVPYSFTGYYPALLEVVTGDGNFINLETNSINGALSIYEDFNFDGYNDHRLYLPSKFGSNEISLIILSDSIANDDDYIFVTYSDYNSSYPVLDSIVVSKFAPDTIAFTITNVTEKSDVINDYSLSPNYPNPFNPQTTINYKIPAPGKVELYLYNIIGQRVLVLENAYKQAGSYKIEVDGTTLSSGVYIFWMKAGTFSDSKKMILIK